MQNNSLKRPSRKADSLKSGAIKIGEDGKKWEVYKTNSGKHKWKRASIKSVKCMKYLKKRDLF